MWGFFKKERGLLPFPKTDLHSHLLPDLDDGVKSFEEAKTVISYFQELGLVKAITTPHIMSDYYKNTASGIKQKGLDLKDYLKSQNISFGLEFAAEYYFDEDFMDLVNTGGDILTFGNGYVLFETNTYTEPMMLNDLIFQLKLRNYKPVLAHPERYQYLRNNYSRVEDLIDRGVYMQVNSLSLTGFYSRPVQKVAQQLVDKKMVHFLGSDCHGPTQAAALTKCTENKYFQKALELPLLNYSI